MCSSLFISAMLFLVVLIVFVLPEFSHVLTRYASNTYYSIIILQSYC